MDISSFKGTLCTCKRNTSICAYCYLFSILVPVSDKLCDMAGSIFISSAGKLRGFFSPYCRHKMSSQTRKGSAKGSVQWPVWSNWLLSSQLYNLEIPRDHKEIDTSQSPTYHRLWGMKGRWVWIHVPWCWTLPLSGKPDRWHHLQSGTLCSLASCRFSQRSFNPAWKD